MSIERLKEKTENLSRFLFFEDKLYFWNDKGFHVNKFKKIVPNGLEIMKEKEGLKMDKNVYVDVDGVLTDFAGYVINKVLNKFDAIEFKIKEDDITEWVVLKENKDSILYGHQITLAKNYISKLLKSPKTYKNLTINLFNYETLLTMFEKNKNVYILTSVYPEGATERLLWLNRYFEKYSDRFIIKTDKTLFAENGILIDDNPFIIKDFLRLGGGGCLYNQPYNKEYSSLNSFNSLFDFYDWCKRKSFLI